MTSVLDVQHFDVIDRTNATSNFVPSSIEIQISVPPATQMDIVSPSWPQAVMAIGTPGVQGPPGLQNVFVGATDPSDETWGMEQLNYIWVVPQ